MGEQPFNLTLFEGVGSKLSSYTISINKHGAFGINAGFYNAEGIKNFTHAMLFYDKVKKVVGFAFTNTSSNKGTFKITHGKNSASVVAHSFFMSLFSGNKNELRNYARRYTPKTYNDEKIGKIFYIELINTEAHK